MISDIYKKSPRYTLLLFFTAVIIGNAQGSSDTASIHGRVTNSASGEGLRKAYLRLAPVAGKAAGYAAVTNDQGSFEIDSFEIEKIDAPEGTGWRPTGRPTPTSHGYWCGFRRCAAKNIGRNRGDCRILFEAGKAKWKSQSLSVRLLAGGRL